MKRSFPPILLLGLAATLLTTGCQIIPSAQPDPTRFYVLSVPAIPSTTEATPPERQMRLGLLPLELPGYLNNTKNLVVRRGPNEVTYLTFDRWAEQLDQGALRLIAQRLTASSQVSGLESYPFDPAVNRDYDLRLRLDRCEGQINEAGDAVALVVLSYEITHAAQTSEIVASGTLRPQGIAWNGRDAAALVAALSQTVLRAAHDLVAALPLYPSSPKPKPDAFSPKL